MKRLAQLLCIICISLSACKHHDDLTTQLIAVFPSAAGGGDTIVLHWKNLPVIKPDISLTLNNEKVHIVSASSDSIVAIVPPMVGAGNIIATVNGKKYETYFTYNYITTVTTVAGTGSSGKQDGAGSIATFSCPRGVAIDGGKIYVADCYNRLIRVIDTSSHDVTSIPISGFDFYSPDMLAVDTLTHLLYVTDFNEHIMRIGTNGIKKILYVGEMPIGGIALGPDHYLYFANQYKNQVFKLDTITGTATQVASMSSPCSMMFDSTGALWITGVSIYKYTLDGTLTQYATDSEFSGWVSAFDKRGNFYEANYINNNLRMIEHSTSRIITLAGSGKLADIDGVGMNASFNGPIGLAVDNFGVMYMSTYNYDTNTGNKIRKITVR